MAHSSLVAALVLSLIYTISTAAATSSPPSLKLSDYRYPDSYFFPDIGDTDDPSLFPMPKCGSFVLEEATIDQMQQAMENGTLTAVHLLRCYRQRIYQTQPFIK